jgi:hypothetical protein
MFRDPDGVGLDQPPEGKLARTLKAMSAGQHYVDPGDKPTPLQLELRREMDLHGLGTFKALGVSEPEVAEASSRLRFKMFSSNTPRVDIEKQTLLEDVSGVDGKTPALACTIACGVGVNFMNCIAAIIWEMPYTMGDFVQRIGRVGRGLLRPERRARIDAFWRGMEIKLKSAEDALRSMCMEDDACRHLQIAKFFAWEAKYMSGRTVEAILAERKIKLGLEMHECCDVCARGCNCTRDPAVRATRQHGSECPVWADVLKRMGRID